MVAETSQAQKPPKAFVSYSWDSGEHREWVADLGNRLRADGVELLLDEWHVRPGDQLPHFMEEAVRESDFVLVVCTIRYGEKGNARLGGVGYEGHIMTAELFAGGNERKYIPLLREGEWKQAAPSWLLGKAYIDFRGNPYPESSYDKLINTMHDLLPRAPVVRHEATSSAQRLSPEAVTRQTKYGEFINAAMRAFSAANKKFVLYKSGRRPDHVIMSEVQDELQRHSDKVNELMHEMLMLSSDPVRKALGEIAGSIIAIQLASMLPALEGEFKEIHAKFHHESLPKFREAVRLEAGLR